MDDTTRNDAQAKVRPAYPSRSRKVLRLVLPALVLLLLALGIVPRLESHADLRRQTSLYSQPEVAVAYPQGGAAVRHLKLPATVQPYAETSIYARTNGYLARWYQDMGSHVDAGQLLADIATPEIDAQLQQARQMAATAQANYEMAKVTAERWTGLLKTHAVSEQEAQQDVATMKADRATLAAARADVTRLQELQSYEHVVAPFPGVVTARNVDVGALINAGSGASAGSELFHLVETDRLRVFIDVPQEFAADVGPGTGASLTLAQQSGRSFTGTVARTAGAIDMTSRTLRIEVDFDNRDGQILPGAYGLIDLAVPVRHPRVSVQVSALMFRPEGVQVAVVDAAGRVQLLPVALGRDFGNRIEIASGLTGSERVIVNPNDAIVAAESVRVASSTGKPT
jgi:membrane fusion protein, multidrug efflux system